MKYRIKQYQSRFSIFASEKYYLYRKKFRVKWDKFIEKGHEKMTIMFIPHNEKKIFNFQISKFIISFFVILFVVILVTSCYALIKNSAIKREEQRLLMTYNDIRSHLLRFEKLTKNVDELIEDMKPEIAELYELAAGTEEMDQIWNLEEFEKKELGELLKIKDILPKEIFTIKNIQKDLICSTGTIKAIKNFIDVRSKVIEDTPSIISNQGHITSLFGWRRSPFGHGRDFHTGIDIAAPPGTPIRATAPGVVVSAGWSGGYGFSVRIKHKYGFETVYGHCQSIASQMNQVVKKGEVIAYVGQTGNATGNHCHYEIRLGNLPINPYPYMSRIW